MSDSPISVLKPTIDKTPSFRLLDAWRGIASLSVVGYHWGDLALRRFSGLEGHWLYIISKYGFLGVQLFFVISGYCIAAAALGSLRKSHGIKPYVLARVRRIFPTYWAGLALIVMFYLGSHWLAVNGLIKENIFTNFDFSAKPLIYYFANITLTMVWLHQDPMLAVAWTLCYEIAFYTIVGLVLLWASWTANTGHSGLDSSIKVRAGRLLVPLHMLTATCLVLFLFLPRSPIFPLDLWPQFGLGVVLFDVISCPPDDPGRRTARLWAGIIFTLMFIFAIARDVPYGMMGVSSQAQYLVADCFALFLLIAHRFDEAWSKNRLLMLLSWVGLFSYSLYLTHFVSILVFSAALQKLALSQSLHYIAYLMAILFAVGVGYAFFLLFERPLLRPRANGK